MGSLATVLDTWMAGDLDCQRKYGMKGLDLLVKTLNDRLTANPGTLPRKLYVIELAEGERFYICDDQIVEGDPDPDRKVDCTIRTDVHSLEILLERPKMSAMLVMSGKLKFDKAPLVIALAMALKELL